MRDARAIVEHLGLEPHPEGGWFRETYRHRPDPDGPGADARGAMTAIYYLLEAGDRSHWHRVSDADEIWHFHAGAPLALTLSPDGVEAQAHRLGPDLMAGQTPQVLVPKGWWQAAESLGDWTLVGCTVAPAFSFDGFEMAPPDWRPGMDQPNTDRNGGGG
ncbi:cupin domain-containing protein [Marivibrio halodurans]|uniref:Cupin domain-containing protein n=1 Tax=Marivibrio halodurans TaxID=2039722 RepID=A0A8J7S9J4_9PROT|nr:cupin domain-containing protein [Marivibrio halodurans]MBP5857947.1 cupin domain-containing protein [Marivibrio halodurans]